MTPQEKETLRKVALEALVSRHPAALNLSMITRRVAAEVDFALTSDDVEGALAFLEGGKFVQTSTESLGSTQYYAATTEGVLHVERGM